jgi:hypothetical protein
MRAEVFGRDNEFVLSHIEEGLREGEQRATEAECAARSLRIKVQPLGFVNSSPVLGRRDPTELFGSQVSSR